MRSCGSLSRSYGIEAVMHYPFAGARWFPIIFLFLIAPSAEAQNEAVVPVEGQPLAANIDRVVRALESLGAPLPAETTAALAETVKARDSRALQEGLDPHVLFVV